MFGISPRKNAARRERPRKLIGQKPPLKLKELWAIRMRLQIEERLRDLALFNLTIDSKLRGCDLVSLRIQDVCQAGQVSSRAIVMQQKTGRPMQFEITEQTRVALTAWIHDQRLTPSDYLFPSRVKSSPHISRRQYARVLASWLTEIGLDSSVYGTHSLRRTKLPPFKLDRAQFFGAHFLTRYFTSAATASTNTTNTSNQTRPIPHPMPITSIILPAPTRVFLLP